MFLLAFLITLFTFFFPSPLFAFNTPQGSTAHGFPFAYVTTRDVNIPLIGAISWIFTGDYTFDAGFFAANLALYFSLFWLIVVKTTRKGK